MEDRKQETDLDWLLNLQPAGITLGLQRMTALLMKLGNPQRNYRVITVAGTNGKGSTARTLAAILSAAGWRTGLYTSPHLSRLGERFVIDGEEAAAGRLDALIGEIRPDAELMGCSFFEVVTAMAFLHFAQAGVDFAVLEVGLGGRFDATNAADPELTLITTIARDHVDYLGEEIIGIAREKGGVMRPGKLTITGAHGEALEELRGMAGQLGARLWDRDRHVRVEARSLGWDGSQLTVTCPAGTASVRTALVGEHQVGNVALAVAAALELGVAQRAISEGTERARWPGRLESFRQDGRRIVLDGAHNAQAAQALVATLHDLEATPYTLVAGFSKDKDAAQLARILGGAATAVVVTEAQLSARSLPAPALAGHFREVVEPGVPVLEAPTLAAALELAARNTPADGTVVVAGSLYLVGEVRPLLSGEKLEAIRRWQ